MGGPLGQADTKRAKIYAARLINGVLARPPDRLHELILRYQAGNPGFGEHCKADCRDRQHA